MGRSTRTHALTSTRPSHLLHDALVGAFLRAYDAGVAGPLAPHDALLHRGAYAAVRLAIIVMADCLA